MKRNSKWKHNRNIKSISDCQKLSPLCKTLHKNQKNFSIVCIDETMKQLRGCMKGKTDLRHKRFELFWKTTSETSIFKFFMSHTDRKWCRNQNHWLKMDSTLMWGLLMLVSKLHRTVPTLHFTIFGKSSQFRYFLMGIFCQTYCICITYSGESWENINMMPFKKEGPHTVGWFHPHRHRSWVGGKAWDIFTCGLSLMPKDRLDLILHCKLFSSVVFISNYLL